MKHGDFTALAREYVNRPGYSQDVLRMIGRMAGMERRDFRVADVGVGTGKLTEEREALGLYGCAVEPNDTMRAEGEKVFRGKERFSWSEGTAEHTGLPTASFDWVLWALPFIRRIRKKHWRSFTGY